MSYLDEKRLEFGNALQTAYAEKRLNIEPTGDDLELYAETQMEILEACKRRVRPSPDTLGIERSACELCPTLCEGYEPFEVFLLETHERAYSNTFIPTLCRNCKCPAYYHPPIIRPLKFPKVLLEGIRKYQLAEDHLNFNGIIAIFSIDYSLLQSSRNSLKAYEDELFLLLQEGGFRVISRAVRVLSNHETEVLGSQVTIPKNNALMNVLKHKLHIQLPNLNKRRTVSIELKNDEAALLLCLSATSYIDSQAQFNKFMQAARQYIPQAFALRYSTKNSTQGLTDTIVFFPEVFTLKRCCTILAPEPEKTIENINEDPIMTFFRNQSMKMRGDDVAGQDKDTNKMNTGKLIDMMNYNGYQPLGPVNKSIPDQDDFLRTLETILGQRRSLSFLKFLLSGCKEPQLIALAGSKVGINFLLTVNPFSFETFSFYSNRDTSALFSYFFPELSSSNRTVIIFRPVTVKSGLNKIFLDIFKINYFVIVKEIFRVLSISEVTFLSRSYEFTPQAKQDFFELMMEGECHIVVLSKFGAVNDAVTICKGSVFGRKRLEKNLLGVKSLYIEHEKEYLDPFKIKLDEDTGSAHYMEESLTHKEEIKTIRNSGENVLFSLNPFSSFNELLDLDSVIDSTIRKNEHPSDEPNIYKRQAALDELREFSRSFNIVVHCSLDIKSAEEEIGLFFPKLLEYQDILLMLRLNAGKLKIQAVELLKNMGMKTINTWQHEMETWYHVVKQGARDEVIGLLHYNCLITEPLGPQHLSSVFEFCETPAVQQQRLDEMTPYLARFSGESLLLTKNAELEKTINYMIMATIGDSCRSSTTEVFWANPDLADVIYKSQIENGQKVEIRVRRAHTTARQDHIEDRLTLTNEFEGMKLYYMHASKMHKRLLPSFFKYRIEPNELDHEITRIFNVEQHMGDVFLNVIAKSMSQTRYLEHSRDTRRTATQDSRGSTSAFMWGRKLAIAIKKLEEVKAEEIEDCGLLYWNGREMVGAMDDVHFHELEIQKYQKCLGDISRVWTQYLTPEETREIQTTLQVILKSKAFEATRDLKQVSLVPEYLDFKNLRINTYTRVAKEVAEEVGRAFKVGLDKDKSALAELKGESSKELTIQDFAIVNVQPSKYSKRHLAGNICWMLSIYLKKLDRRLEVTDNNVDEYEVLVDSILQGFLKNYNGDLDIEGYSCLKIEIFLFHLYETWKTLLILDDLEIRIQNAQDELNRKKYFRQYTDELDSFQNMITSLTYEKQRWEYDFVMQLESLARLDIYSDESAGSSKLLSIPHNRYFKFYGLDEFEPNLNHPKYPNTILQEKFPVLPQLNQGGEFEKRWFNPPRLPRYNLRDVPDEAWKFSGTRVPATKWVTQERLKKIVKNAVLQLINTGINKKK